MNESHINQPVHDEVLIDRLAAGELDHAARRRLFEWLDGEPARWRRCALALLEARELDEALADWKAEIPPAAPTISSHHRVGTASRGPEGTTTRPIPPRRWPNLLALAASLLLAFGLGVSARGYWLDQPHRMAQNPPQATNARNSGAKGTETNVASREPPMASQPDRGHSMPNAVISKHETRELISPYVRSQLERRGYEIESRHAVLPAILPDGRRVMLPVDQFQLRYVGHRTS